MLGRIALRTTGALIVATASTQAAQTYTDSLNDQVGSGNKSRDLSSVVVDNDATNLYITINLNSGADLNPTTAAFDYAVGMTTGPGANGDTSADTTWFGNAYKRVISIDQSQGGMVAWVGAFGVGASGGVYSGVGFNDYVWNAAGQTWGTAVRNNNTAPGYTLGSQSGTTTHNTFTLPVPMADLSTLNLHVGQTIYFDIYSTGTSGQQTAYDSLANPAPTNNGGQVSTANTIPYNGTLLLSYTIHGIAGDANNDGKINADDYAIVDRGASMGLAGWSNGDFNNDGVVGSADYLAMDTNFAAQGGPLSPSFLDGRAVQFGDAYVQSLVAAVPEPTGVGLFTLLAAPAIARRRRVR